MQNSQNTLIIRVGDGPGLGDNLFYSHLPRIAKTLVKDKFDKVYVHNPWSFRHPDHKRLIWEMNPYVDGVIDSNSPSLDAVTHKEQYFRGEFADFNLNENILDKTMLFHGLDDGARFHEPEIYYKPKFRPEFNKVIFDPNWISNEGGLNLDDILDFFDEQGIKIEAVMAKKQGGAKHAEHHSLFDYSIDVETLDTPTLEDFCDLLYSAKAIYCFVTGTATLAAAIKKPANVILGKKVFINPVYFHSKLHKYWVMPRYNIVVDRVWHYRFLFIKGHVRLDLNAFKRLNERVQKFFPKSLATKLCKWIDKAFVASPSKRNIHDKAHYEKLKKELFVPRKKA